MVEKTFYEDLGKLVTQANGASGDTRLGAARGMRGLMNGVKSNGTLFDHLTKFTNALRGLTNLVESQMKMASRSSANPALAAQYAAQAEVAASKTQGIVNSFMSELNGTMGSQNAGQPTIFGEP